MTARGGAAASEVRATPGAGGRGVHDLAPRRGGARSLLQAPGIGDRVYLALITAAALCVPLLLAIIVGSVAAAAWPSLDKADPAAMLGTVWDVPRGRFGIAPALLGTLVTTVLAVLLAAVPALGTAVFLSEMAPPRLARALGLLVDLLAAVPSVVYGLWGLLVLVPLLRSWVLPVLVSGPGRHLGIFAGPAYGPSILAATLVLGIMIVPYVCAVSREVLRAVPRAQREAALALGATHWEMVRDVVLPGARAGIIGAFVLGVGRALGEAMAVTMVIGNRHDLPTSLAAPGHSLGALLATEFSQAHESAHVGALVAVVGLLLLVSLAAGLLARLLVWRVSAERAA